jgi:hypothetical protein
MSKIANDISLYFQNRMNQLNNKSKNNHIKAKKKQNVEIINTIYEHPQENSFNK